MAGKPKNRLELRRQYEASEPRDPMEDDGEESVAEDDDGGEGAKKAKKKKAPAKPKARAPKAPKPAARVRIVWAVVNDAFKTVGTFDYNQKEAAEARAAELTAKGKGNHFLQRVKEAMAEGAPGLGASIPRPEAPASRSKSAKSTAKKAAARVEELEEEEIEDEEVEEVEEDEDDDDE